MSLTRLALKIAAPVPRVEDFERYLFIGPHPDDIEIGAGATAAKLAGLGKQVCFLVCTDGRFGLANAPEGTTEEALVSLRQREAMASAAVLGVRDVRFLGLRDGAGYSMEALLKGIAETVSDFRPDMMFAPDPFVPSESHEDHLRTGRAARQVACFAPYAGIMEGWGAQSVPVRALAYYMTARPNRFVDTRGLLSRQLDAILCHRTQFPPDAEDYGSIALYLKLRSLSFGLRTLKGRAEGFRVLGRTQMHCLPEAGL